MLNDDGSLNRANNPCTTGSAISIYATGLGEVTNQPATGQIAASSPLSDTKATPAVTIGGLAAKVLFSGLAPGFVGVYQVNVQVPNAVPTGSAIPMAMWVGGATSNTVTIAVTQSAGPQPSFVLYGVDGGDESSSTLYQIDPATGQTKRIGDIPFEPITDIAFTPDGNLYAIEEVDEGFGGTSELLQVDPLTGFTTDIGNFGFDLAVSLVSDTDGTLYAATKDSQFLRVDRASGKATLVGSFGAGYESSGDLAFDSSGVLYASIVGSSSDLLITVDKSTGAANIVGDIGYSQVFGLAFLPDGRLIGVANGDDASPTLIQIDKGTGQAQAIADLTGINGLNGLAGGNRTWPSTLTVLNKLMTATVDQSSCVVPQAVSSFSSQDSQVYVWFDVANARMGANVSAVWQAPGGGNPITVNWDPVAEDGFQCFWASLNVSGNTPAQEPGAWAVKITWDGAQLFTLTFTISVP